MGAALMAYASTNANWIAPIASELGSDNRSTMHRALRIAFLLQMIIICLFSFAGILWHGKDVPANYLLSFPRGIRSGMVRTAFVTVVLVNVASSSFPLRLSMPT